MSSLARFLLPSVTLAVIGILAGCQQQGREVSIPANTPIKLVTITELESGVSADGMPVQFIVEEPVIVEGVTVISRGALATGTVDWSRRGSAVRAVMNQPARLAVKLSSVSSASGVQIPIVPKEPREGHPDQIEFRRSNANVREAMTRLAKMVGDEEVRQSLTRLRIQLDRGNVEDMREQETSTLGRTLQDLGMDHAADKVRGDAAADIEAAVALTKGDRSDTIVESGLRGLGIAGELLYLGSRAADVGGLIPGSLNIAIPIGTRVEARTAETVTVRVP